eukprot:m.100970 g.100970  ORF g.100970 m.100970 type:complete len:105 (+) comp13187_c0_seq5:254-568(+)
MAPNWLYGEMTRPESEELMMAQGQADGDFFVRPRGDDYVLVLLFKGKPTSHLMSEQGGTWLINKRKYGPASSMEEVCQHQRYSHMIATRNLSVINNAVQVILVA